MHWNIHKAPALNCEIEVPGDKSISHRAVLLSSISTGACVVRGFLASEDCLATMGAMRALGIEIERPTPNSLIIYGKGGRFQPPAGDLDCGNSGTTMRLLSGLLAGQAFESRLVGDPSLSKRPMKRVMDPLSLMGARLEAEGANQRPPLRVRGGTLKAIDYVSPVASAQVKSAVLLAGLFAEGTTSVREPELSRDHTERMLEYYGIPPVRDGLRVSVQGGARPEPRDFRVPGDISSAAFWLVAAAAHPGAHVRINQVGLNPSRTGILAVLTRMGARVREFFQKEQGEPIGTVDIEGAELRATHIGGKEIPNVIDELPILAVAAALARGTTVISDAAELRVKETDRLAAIAGHLRAMGVPVVEREDGMEITGGGVLRGARLDSLGDHRIAMAFAIAGLFAEGETVITGTECVNTSYPGFYEVLQKVTAGSAGGEAVVIRQEEMQGASLD
ncbi:MAG: 3-phosphoshikimate 1-carboxyvinyltransferase [Verrucomicrobiota bacterium]|jgi:3-phosphoshikimate 1-carboxyvinyltransferase